MMFTDVEIFVLFAVILLLGDVWTRTHAKELQRETELKLWMTVHRVALRHSITLPEGLSLAEAGAYIEQMIEAGEG